MTTGMKFLGTTRIENYKTDRPYQRILVRVHNDLPLWQKFLRIEIHLSCSMTLSYRGCLREYKTSTDAFRIDFRDLLYGVVDMM